MGSIARGRDGASIGGENVIGKFAVLFREGRESRLWMAVARDERVNDLLARRRREGRLHVLDVQECGIGEAWRADRRPLLLFVVDGDEGRKDIGVIESNEDLLGVVVALKRRVRLGEPLGERLGHLVKGKAQVHVNKRAVHARAALAIRQVEFAKNILGVVRVAAVGANAAAVQVMPADGRLVIQRKPIQTRVEFYDENDMK